ncbi:MAG: phage terminase large subunit family protein [Methanosarcinales archaeon]
MTDYVLNNPGTFAIIASVGQDQSSEHIRTIKSILEVSGLKKEVINFSEPYNRSELNFRNGSRIHAIPQSEGQVGFHPHFLFVDEMSRISTEFFWSVLNPMGQAIKDQVRVLASTPKGVFNAFYELFHSKTYEVVDVKISECPWITKERLQEARSHMPEVLYKQEILGEFIETTYSVFTAEVLEKAKVTSVSSYIPPFVAGVDLGRKRDYSAIVVLDSTGNVYLSEFFKGSWESQIMRLKNVIESIPVSLTYVDSTGVGDGIFEFLSKTVDCYFRPYQFTSKSKMDLVNKLVVALEQGRIHIPVRHKHLLEQLSMFSYLDESFEKTGARRGFDDLVMALGLANLGLSSQVGKSMALDFIEDSGYGREVMRIA